MEEKLFIKIDATPAQGTSINSHTEIHLECGAHFAISVLVNILEKESEIRELFEMSLEVLKKKELVDGINMN